MKLDLRGTMGGYGQNSPASRQLPFMQDANMWRTLARMVPDNLISKHCGKFLALTRTQLASLGLKVGQLAMHGKSCIGGHRQERLQARLWLCLTRSSATNRNNNY